MRINVIFIELSSFYETGSLYKNRGNENQTRLHRHLGLVVVVGGGYLCLRREFL